MGRGPNSDLAAGSAYNFAGVIDARTGERFHCDAGAGRTLAVTSPRVADERRSDVSPPPIKPPWSTWKLPRIARLAGMREHPFYCIKGVSDALQR